MKEYPIYPKDDKKVFFEMCRLFEETYPMFVKEKMLCDFPDSELLQSYHFQEKRAVMILERTWFNEILLRADFEPTLFLEKLCGV